jgi:hypothetical protein
LAELSLDQGIETLSRRTRVATLLLYAYIATTLLTVVAGVGQISGQIVLETGDELAMMAGLSYLLSFVALIASIVIIGMWIYRANANLRAAGFDDLEYSPGWAVGWYFIPIANLFKPFQAMREVWAVSHREAEGFTSQTDYRLTAWWGFWLVGNMISNVAFRFDANAGEGAARTGLALDIFSGLLLVGAAWFLLQILSAVNTAQRSMLGLASAFA